MPELPEVETMRRHLAGLIGAKIVEVIRPRSGLRPIKFRPSYRAFRQAAIGSEITGLGRLGKRLVIELAGPENEKAIVFEPRMTGLVTLESPPDEKHVRVVFVLEGSSCPVLHFWDARGLSVLQIMDLLELQALATRLGPDALHVSGDYLQAKLGNSSKPVKLGLMDQAVLAGIGNLYASEILFFAKIHPATPCRAVDAAGWRRIARGIRQVLRAAIDAQGSTLEDGTYRNPQGEVGRYQFSHYVYQKDGQICPRCRRGIIGRIKQGGRSSFFCPVCQPPVRSE